MRAANTTSLRWAVSEVRLLTSKGNMQGTAEADGGMERQIVYLMAAPKCPATLLV